MGRREIGLRLNGVDRRLEVEDQTLLIELIRGLGLVGTKLHPLQEAFIDRFAFQCGYCTPGMIVSAKALLEARPDPDAAAVRHWMEGNICRCTGYQTIVDAVLDAADQMRSAR